MKYKRGYYASFNFIEVSSVSGVTPNFNWKQNAAQYSYHHEHFHVTGKARSTAEARRKIIYRLKQQQRSNQQLALLFFLVRSSLASDFLRV